MSGLDRMKRRLRDRSGDRPTKVGPGAPEAASETQ